MATVIGELAEDGTLDANELVSVAAMYPKSSVRLLGSLLDFLEIDLDQDRLHSLLAESPCGRLNAYLTPGARHAPGRQIVVGASSRTLKWSPTCDRH